VWTLPVPVWGWMQGLAARLLPAMRGPLSRLDQDLIADNAEVMRLLGITPRGFRPTRQMLTSAAAPARH